MAEGLQALPRFAIAAGTLAAALAAQAPLVRKPEVALLEQGEAVVADYQATGMTLRQHPLALLRPVLDRPGHGDTRDLATQRSGAWLRLPGQVLIRQRPGSAKGMVLLTIENEHGVGNLVVYAAAAARDRAALVADRLLLADFGRGPGGAGGRPCRAADQPPHRPPAVRALRPAGWPGRCPRSSRGNRLARADARSGR